MTYNPSDEVQALAERWRDSRRIERRSVRDPAVRHVGLRLT
jgi:hypothetical protein